MHFLGIDPDTHGALVLLDSFGDVQFSDHLPLIGTDFDVSELARVFMDLPDDTRCVVEKVQSRSFIPPDASPGMRAGIIGRSTKLFYLRGLIMACAAYRGVGLIEPTPAAWMKPFSLGGGTRDTRKARIGAAAAKRWPALGIKTKKSWSKGDAAFLAEYGRIQGTPAAEAGRSQLDLF